MKWFHSPSITMIFWCIFVMIGTAGLVYTHSPSNPKAARLLMQNEIVQPTDLDWNYVVGRYVARPGGIKAGEMIRAGDLADVPLSLKQAGKVLLTAVVQRRSIKDGSMAAGKDGSLCNENKAIGRAHVVSYQCPGDEAAAECTAIAELVGDLRETSKALSDIPPGARLRFAGTCS